MKRPLPPESSRTIVRALRRVLDEGDRTLVGASWWYQDLAQHADRLMRGRRLVRLTSLGAGLSLVGGCAELPANLAGDQGAPEEALRVQQRDGWNAGQEMRPLVFTSGTPFDVDGSGRWRQGLDSAAAVLAPAQPALAPFYVPTLFQALTSPAGAGLRDIVTPIFTPAMAVAYQRGLGLLSLFESGQIPPDVALVVDLPGPEAVAVAAALASRYDPVFTFDNWPHPAGVVPSHLTLAAALYYLPQFERAKAQRPQPAPPVFVLDRARLAHYDDDPWAFDNRYLARLPGGPALKSLPSADGAGIRRLLYVTADGNQESDDLNEELVDLEHDGVEVRMLALDDFTPDATLQPGEVEAYDSVWPNGPYWFGGNAYYHRQFGCWYGWRRGATIAMPGRLAKACNYHPQPRTTMFSGLRGAPAVRLPGFGQVWRGGLGIPMRSGSFGRWRGSVSS